MYSFIKGAISLIGCVWHNMQEYTLFSKRPFPLCILGKLKHIFSPLSSLNAHTYFFLLHSLVSPLELLGMSDLLPLFHVTMLVPHDWCRAVT